MSATFVLLLYLGLFLMDTRSQRTFPYVSFMGQTLANHSYANFSLVGTNDTDSVQCHTDLTTCCNMQEESHRGDWYFPNETRLQFSGDVYVANESQRADIFRSETATSPSGIYRCDIPTLALHSNVDFSVRDRVYVGLYAGNRGLEYIHTVDIFIDNIFFILPFLYYTDSLVGVIRISGNVMLTVDSDLNGVSPQFTLTCISTGGPATTVTWARDSTTVTEGTETVLDDPVTSQYTHSLTVTGIYPGMYMCTVANTRPSSSSSSLYVLGIGVLVFFGYSDYALTYCSCLSSH